VDSAKTKVLAAAAVIGALSLGACGSSTTGSSSSSASAGSASAAGSASSASLPAYAATLQREIPALMKANAIPGVVILIKSKDQGDWSATFGIRELGTTEPMLMEDSFRIGSNTKTMTSTVILQLVQEGKLKLDDPISKFRPDVPNGENITIAELSEMRSGLYSYTSSKEFNATLDNEPQKAWTPDELLAIAFAEPPLSPPGQVYNYSNTNIVLLGVVIEQLTGMPVAEAFQKRIFEPLGLKHTSMPAATDASLPTPHPQGYQFGTNVQDLDSYAVPPAQLPAALDGSLPPINNTNANPSWAFTAGAAISTPEDLATYVKALVEGGLLDEATQKLRLDSIKPLSADGPKGLGYGLGIVEFAPTIFGHDGQIPGYSTFMSHDTAKGNTIIIGTNLSASPVNGNNAALELAKSVLVALYGASAVPGADPAGAGKPSTTGSGSANSTSAGTSPAGTSSASATAG
jgi:D-alanyl-D-alanine carboxypeptidase